MKLIPIVATTLVLPCFAASAFAAKPASWLEGDHGLRVASGEAARVQRLLTEQPTRDAAIAFGAFKEAHGDAWSATFDRATGVAVRVFGKGIAVPGSMMSPESAEAAARAVLDQHRELFAPGSGADDFMLESNTVSFGTRVVAYTQHRDGLRVLGGQVSFRFKNDRLFVIGSEAFPFVRVEHGKTVSSALAEKAASRWISRDYGSTLKVKSTSGPMILSLVRRSGSLDHHRVLEVKLDARDPIAAWSVWIDAANGAPIARKQTLMFADGTLLINAPERWPGDTRLDYPGVHTELVIDGNNATSDDQGLFTWTPDQPAAITARARGPQVTVINESGAETTQMFTLDPAASYAWNAADDELVDAQLTTFVHGHKAKERVRQIAPNANWIDDQLQANVNIQDVCNAFSDGVTINFFIAGRGCENTGRLPDVIHHEYGHAIHAHAIIRGAGDFDSALSEGGADYFAATITNDHGMGRGFFGDNQPLRDIDPMNTERVWPDDIAGDPHETGLIYAGAMWDLRKALITNLGEQPGIEHTDAIWFQVFERASDIPASYVEVLAADDDDGDLSNGTPNICDIDEAFAAHGLAMASTARPGVALPRVDGLKITLPVATNSVCPGTNVLGAELTWQIRKDQSINGTLPMGQVNEGFSATIPSPMRTDEVIQYRVDVTLENGDVLVFPDNAADPYYELYVGEVVPIYCTDFELDPMMDGWTHTLEAGQATQGADDWQWGAPQGTQGSGDPGQAYSGTYVYGNDLGGGNYNGKYQADKTNRLHSPEVSTMGYSIVRLQYRRWLTVEDGMYDHARIIANSTEVWSNMTSNGDGHHSDKEWRFHDVDVSAAIVDGRVQIFYEIESDGGLELGGWTIDDFCIVGVGDNFVPKCGDGVVSSGESCDDGNAASGDGCSASCTIELPSAMCGDGVLDAGEACDDGNFAGGDGCSPMCGIEGPNAPICGNAMIELGEACDDGVFDGRACSPGCVLPMGPMVPGGGLDETNTGCGCTTSAERKQQELLGSLILLGVLALSILVRKRSQN